MKPSEHLRAEHSDNVASDQTVIETNGDSVTEWGAGAGAGTIHLHMLRGTERRFDFVQPTGR